MKSLLFVATVLFCYPSLFAQDVTWPKQLTNFGDVLTVYQPQIQTWTDHKKLDFRQAFSIQPAAGKQTMGVWRMTANTAVDMDSHKVLLTDFVIVETHFPSLSETDAASMDNTVRAFLTAGKTMTISLEQIVATMDKDTAVKKIAVNNDPPVIFYNEKPTILLQPQGDPVKASTGKQDLDFVFNINYPLFFDKTNSLYYLYDGLEWRKSPGPGGPYSFTSTLPQSLIDLKKDTNWSDLANKIPAVTTQNKKMPAIYYSLKSAELILFDGTPAFTSISGTSLKYATNTDSEIFLSSSNNTYYYLTAGRWFSSTSLHGPWTFATDKLPADFAKIPMNSPVAGILSSVPGTEQAIDAVMIAQIPTTVEVNATEAAKQVNITYSGDPQFKEIEGTDLSYAVNTTDKVIQVSTSQYYACVQGIWFVAPGANGPWQTATTVPGSIYEMPPSSPVYNVTYVTQTVNPSGVVEASYTSGYMGVFVTGVAAGVVITSGTGYYYPPYYYYPPMGFPICYGYPMTFGVYAYHPYAYGGVAYHSTYNPYTGAYGRSATAYGPYGSATAGHSYNPYTGTYARGATVSNGYGSRSAGQAYNPYTGAGAATRQGSSPYGQWGSSVATNGKGDWAQTAHSTTANGTVAGGRTSNGGAMVAGSGANGSGSIAKTGSGDMYASKDGNVYKKTDDGWNKYDNGGWSNTNKASQSTSAANKAGSAAGSGGFGGSNNMDQDFQNRQRGNAQTQQFNNRSAGGGGGGGRFGGGGGGGGGFRRR